MLPGGGFLIADTKNHRIRKVAADGTITTVAGTGIGDFSGDGGPADEAELESPGGVAALPGGGYLIADTNNHLIREVTPDGDIDTVAGGSSGPGSGLLDEPQNIAPLPGGDFLIADTGSHVIRRISTLGIATVVAGTGSEGYSGDDGLAILAELDAPYDVVALPGGGFLFSDHDRHVVRKVDSLGTITTVAGGGASTAERIPATTAELDSPTGLAALASGNFLVALEGEHAVRSVSASGVIETIAGSGVQGFGGDLGTALAAKFDSPLGIDANPPGSELLVADMNNNRVRAVRGVPFQGTRAPAGQPARAEAGKTKTTPPPVLGKSVAVSKVKGKVWIRWPGGKRFVVLRDPRRMPVGSVIDVRRGTVALSSALDTKGRSQTAEFWAGVFEVRQKRSGRGMTDIILRGAKAKCPAASGAKAGMSAKRKRRRGRRLWAKDDRGRFRTRGGHSVATTRGTRWLTEDRCGSTVTRVFDGAVVVRNRHTGKRVTVRAGKRYVARRKR